MTKRKTRRGILGGTFSPIHYGHLICAEKTRQDWGLDIIDFAVSSNPPNKPFGVLDAEDRYDMTVAATEDNPHFRASRVDIDHRGTGYTLLTMEAMRRQYKRDELFYLTSAEYLDPSHRWHLPRWVGAKELFEFVTFLVFPRDKQDVEQARAWAANIPEAKIEVLDAPSPPISSTLIRDLVVAGKSIWYTTPWPVQQMIYKKGHYHTAETPRPCHNAPASNAVDRVAIFSGSFDPINYADLLFAEWTRQEYGHGRVLFVPTATAFHGASNGAPAEARYRMAVAATAENPFFDTSRVDIDRGTSSYALLTVDDLSRRLGDKTKLDYVVRSEYLEPDHRFHLTKWMGAEELFKRVRIIVKTDNMSNIEHARELAKQIKGAQIEVPYAPLLPVSGAEIRSLVKQGGSIRYMTPFVVQQAIQKDGLYKRTRKSSPRR